jgi:hypothetical protein
VKQVSAPFWAAGQLPPHCQAIYYTLLAMLAYQADWGMLLGLLIAD